MRAGDDEIIDTLGEARGPLSVGADFSFLVVCLHTQVMSESFCWSAGLSRHVADSFG